MAGKGQRKSDKTLRQSRKADSLSDPVKDLGGYDQAGHLGDKLKHNEDAIRQQEWIRRQEAAKLGVKPEDLDESIELTESAHLVGFTGSARDEEVIKRSNWNADNLRDDILGTKGLIVSMACIGKPGCRDWVDLEGAKWVSVMMDEKKVRANYVNASRKPVENGPKPLQVILARLPPWEGSTVGPELLSDPVQLKKRLVKLCEDFSHRYNVDVVGAVVHRESNHDLHVHLVFSQTRERTRPKKMQVRDMRVEKKKIHDEIRAELRSQGKPATNRTVSMVFKKKEQAGELSHRFGETDFVWYERIRRKEKNPRRSTLGHAFVCKMQTWRAADTADKDAVAAFRDKPPNHPRFDYSFRQRFAAAESRGEILEDLWWNLWLGERWRKLCLDGLAQELSEKSAALGREMASSYLKYGSTVPTLAERLVVEKRNLEVKVSEQSERIAELAIELEEASAASLADRNRLAQVDSKAGELERERTSLVDRLTASESDMARLVEVLKPGEAESPVAAAERVATIAEAAPTEEEITEMRDRLDELNSQSDQIAQILQPQTINNEPPLDTIRRLVDERGQIEKALENVEPGGGDIVAGVERTNADLAVARDEAQKLRETLQPEVGETLADAARRIATLAEKPPVERLIIEEVEVVPPELLLLHAEELANEKRAAQQLTAELEAERNKATSQPIAEDVQEVARILLGRMEKSEDKEKWDTRGSTASRATAFLAWLESEPIRLLAEFKKLVAPIKDEIKNWPPAQGLLKFVGFGKSK